jgi:hypothetical protein
MEIKKTLLGLLTYNTFGEPKTRVVKINVCRPQISRPVNLSSDSNEYYFYEFWFNGELHYKEINKNEFNKMLNDLLNSDILTK